ncbi:hypothetical protein L7F22_067799 [Adiantum nelumboides]|nr:hypothetical protein [Adiantum nelumboides]
MDVSQNEELIGIDSSMTDKPKENSGEGFSSQDVSVGIITMQEDMIVQQGIMTEEQKEQEKDDLTAKRGEQGKSKGQEILQQTETEKCPNAYKLDFLSHLIDVSKVPKYTTMAKGKKKKKGINQDAYGMLW